MAKSEKPDSTLTHLPKFNNRSIDVPPCDLDFAQFALKEEGDIFDVYKSLSLGIAYLFEQKGLVEIEAYVYNVNLRGKVIHYQVNVLGRSPETGQLYTVYLM